MAAGRTAAAVLAAARLVSGDDGTAAPSVLPTPAPSPLRALGGDDDDGSGGGIKMSSTELLFIPVAVVVVGLLLMMCYLFFQSKPPDGPPEFAKPADGPEEAKEPDAAPPEAEDWSAKAEVQEGREGDVEAAPEPPRPNVVAVDDLLSGGGARDLGVLGVFCCTQGRDLLGGASPSGGAPGEPPADEDPDAIPLTIN